MKLIGSRTLGRRLSFVRASPIAQEALACKVAWGSSFRCQNYSDSWRHKLPRCDFLFRFSKNHGAHSGEGHFLTFFEHTIWVRHFLTFFSGDLSGLIGVGHFVGIFLKTPKHHIFWSFKPFFDIFSALKCQKNVWLVASALRLANNSLAKCPGCIWPASGPEGKRPGDVCRRAVQVTVSACVMAPAEAIS